MKQAEAQQAASVSVLRQSMDVMRSKGNQMVQLLASSGTASQQASEVTDPAMGTSVDTYA